MLYYGLVIAAVVMFGFQFLCNQKYQQLCGNSFRASMVFMLGSSAAGVAAMLIINRFRIGFTPFTVLMATVCALNAMGSTVCNLKALSRINLSLFSLFNMLGGMALPFCAGILLYGEPLTIGKTLCLITVAIAMIMTIERGGKKGGGIYYAGIFFFNGMSGVISKIYTSAPYAISDEVSFSIWSGLITMVIALICLPFARTHAPKPGRAAALSMGGFGLLNRVANLFLLLALAKLPASVQYPMVTGGVIIVSTLLAFFSAQKPRRRELAATLVSFAGILCLFLD